MRLNALWVGLALCGISRAALGQSEPKAAPPSDAEALPAPPPAPAGALPEAEPEPVPTPTPTPAPAPVPAPQRPVTVGPQQREEAPHDSSNTDDVFGGGHSRDEQRERVARPRAFRANRHWYGWQVLISDAISVSLIAVGSSAGSVGTVAVPGIAGYALGAPVIHLAHGRPGITAASLSLRLSVPLVGASIGERFDGCTSGTASSDHGICTSAGFATGFFLGVALASALDAALFAWDKPKAKAGASASFGVAPVLSADGKRGELRAFGQF